MDTLDTPCYTPHTLHYTLNTKESTHHTLNYTNPCVKLSSPSFSPMIMEQVSNRLNQCTQADPLHYITLH